MPFSHPLARSAKVFVAHGRDGTEQQILVIATTAELDPQGERYKKRVVEKLSAAARDYVARSDRVSAFLLYEPDERLASRGGPPPPSRSNRRSDRSSWFFGAPGVT